GASRYSSNRCANEDCSDPIFCIHEKATAGFDGGAGFVHLRHDVIVQARFLYMSSPRSFHRLLYHVREDASASAPQSVTTSSISRVARVQRSEHGNILV